MPSDDRVPGYLGRVLDAENGPVGTCFQVVPGVLVTAWHVLRDAGVGDLGDVVRVDPLGGGEGFAARVVHADQLHDLGLMRAESSLTDVVPGLVDSDRTRVRTEVMVTGCADLRDAHQYQFLDAPGQWAGGTTRDDGVRLGRLSAGGVMRGMSGAPVLSDDGVVGVVRARYNTDDGWGRDTVWVARTEDLEPLLRDIGVEGSARDRAEQTKLPAAGGTCPYPGLAAFDSSQSAWFFGRKDLTARLLDRLVIAEERGMPLLVVGVSGSGKSSLLHAGLQPALRRGDLPVPGSADWPQVRLTPGSRPLTELTSRVAALAGVSVGTSVDDARTTPATFAALVRQAAIAHARQRERDDPGRVVLIIDQLEEIFTLCEDPEERAAFVEALRAAAASVADDETTPSAVVIASLRTDFFSACADEPGLAEILQDNQFLVGRMSPAELRSVVEGPAGAVGLDLEPGFVDRVLDDAVDGYQPGSLPLLAYALEATWAKRRGNTMTLAGYQESGGVRGAISTAAETLFRSMDAEQRRHLRRLLLALVAVGDGVDDTRRRVSKEEVTGGDALAESVLNRLVATRLVTVDRDAAGVGTVEIAHEALLRAWRRLTDWLDEDRAGLVVHRRLSDATNTWVRLERDEGSLYRGAQLADTRAWLDEREDRRASLTEVELEFVTASEVAEDAAREAVRRNTLRLRRLVGALSVLLVVAMVAGGLAIWQQRVADDERARAERQRAAAVSRLYAQESLTARDADPRRSLLLAMASWQLTPTVEARGALLSAQLVPYRGTLDPDDGRLVDADLSPDGTTAALATTTGSITVWDTASQQQVAELTEGGTDGELSTVRFSPDGKVLATTHISENAEHRLRLWDPRTHTLMRSLPVPGNVIGVAFNADGTRLATVSGDSPTIILWEVASGRRIRTFDKGGAGFGVAFSQDGSLLAAGGGDNRVRLWQAGTGRQLAAFRGHEKYVTSVAFSPNGRLLSSSSADGTVRLWNPRDREKPSIRVLRPAVEEGEFIREAEFSPDGKQVVAGTNAGKGVQRWRVDDGAVLPAFLGHTNGVSSVDYGPDGHTVLSGSVDGSAVLWRAQDNVIYQTYATNSVAFSVDQKLMAVAIGDTVKLWDTDRRSFVRELKTGTVYSLSFSPDSTQLATAGIDGTVRLWHTESGRSGRPGIVEDDMAAYSVRFSPNGKILTAYAGPTLEDVRSGAVGSDIRYVQLQWNLADSGADPIETVYEVGDISSDPYPTGEIAFAPGGKIFAVPLSTGAIELRQTRTGELVDTLNSGHGAVRSVAFDSDGTKLATGGEDRKLRLWDIASRKQIGSALSGHNGTISDVAFLPDGETLASISQSDVSMRLWSVPDHRLLAAVPTLGNLNDLAVQPETGLVAVTGVYAQVDLLDPDPSRVLADLCSVFPGRTLAEEWESLGKDPDNVPRC